MVWYDIVQYAAFLEFYTTLEWKCTDKHVTLASWATGIQCVAQSAKYIVG